MKKLVNFFGIIALVAVMVTISGCATSSSIGGTRDPHGIISGNGAARITTQGATEIATYTVIMGLVDSGYDEYSATVKAAEAQGRQIITVKKWYFVMTKVTAYAR